MLIMTLAACGGDNVGELRTYSVSGHVQKGPFANGSSLAVSELDAGLSPTGLVFNTELADDSGVFDLKEATVAHSVARLTADGFYFDENRGELSSARLELHALADLATAQTANVNLLGHLERPRTEYLVRDGGMDFASARAQAHDEVLAVFGMTGSSVDSFETLDISQGGDGDAMLLAASVLLQGYRSVGELSELLSAIATDLRTDGTLDSAPSGSALMNAAVLVDLADVRENLEARYAALGITATIGDFEAHVDNFRTTASWPFDAGPAYPEDVPVGENLLDPARTTYSIGEHSLTAEIPEGITLTVTITGTAGMPWFYSDAGPWRVSPYDFANNQQSFESTIDDGRAHMTLWFEGAGAAQVDYFENGDTTPTMSKSIDWDCPPGGCACGEEQAECGGVCVDIKENNEHCGACDVTCGVDQTCQDMTCIDI